ncbi:MAG: beta-lactamase family protein [Lentisphaeraceae bacterium]|nr:beta-lactamase family protein [Lentisphaeraceae bacterium]
MSFYKSLFLVLLVSFTFACQSVLTKVDPGSVGISPEKIQKVNEVVDALIAKKRLAGASVMIARQGKVCFFETYGMMDLKRQKVMQKDTIFRIYSMSKAITSAAVMQLVEQGKIDLHAPVKNYIPEFSNLQVYNNGKPKSVKNDLTTAHLLTHTSGTLYGASGEYGKLLKKANALKGKHDLKGMAKSIASVPLAFEPGTDWAYGTSIDILGYLVQVVSKQDFADYLKEHILKPLKMNDTDFYVPASKVERFAANYNSDGKGLLSLKDDPATSRYLTKPILPSGGGGLVSTMSDYMKFLLCISNKGTLDGERILKEVTVDLMTKNHVSKEAGYVKFGQQVRDGIGYGYGFAVSEKLSKFAPDRKVGDYGWGGAASTHYWVSPEDDLVVITMEQTMPYSFMLETALKSIISESIIRD